MRFIIIERNQGSVEINQIVFEKREFNFSY